MKIAEGGAGSTTLKKGPPGKLAARVPRGAEGSLERKASEHVSTESKKCNVENKQTRSIASSLTCATVRVPDRISKNMMVSVEEDICVARSFCARE